MSTPNDTLRAHLEAIRDEARDLPAPRLVTPETVTAYDRALAALAILDEAPHFDSAVLYRNGQPQFPEGARLVPDPGGRAAPPTREGAQSAAGSSSTTSRITHE